MKDLMQPRYKVIADYPCAIHSVGDIILTYKSAMSYAVKIDEVSDKICLADYPAIFRQLEWWEERELEDMPQYVKLVNTQPSYRLPNGVIRQVIGWEKGVNDTWICDCFPPYIHCSNLIPSTMEEYLM